MSNRKFTIETASGDEKSFMEVFEMLVAEHAEVGYVPLDASKAAENAYRVMKEGMTFVARSASGKAIGTIGLTELSYWYANDTFLQDGWFYVRPEYRRGKVGVALMRAAREAGDARKKIVLITVHNPHRKIKQTRMALVSQDAGYVPFGYTIKMG